MEHGGKETAHELRLAALGLGSQLDNEAAGEVGRADVVEVGRHLARQLGAGHPAKRRDRRCASWRSETADRPAPRISRDGGDVRVVHIGWVTALGRRRAEGRQDLALAAAAVGHRAGHAHQGAVTPSLGDPGRR